MTYMTKIHFSGLMVFLTYENPVKVIIPKVKVSGSIGEHVAYIAFRKNKAQVSGWTPTPFKPNTTEFYQVTLDGDETITLNQGGAPLRFGEFLPRLKKKYCSGLNTMKDAYKNGPDAARVILTGGDDVGWHVTHLKRIETIVVMHSGDYPLTLTATNSSGTKTLVFRGEANIIIGNSDKADIAATANVLTSEEDANSISRVDDFLFYYQMFEENAGCTASPNDSDADGNPNEKDPVVELPPPTRAIDIACSNSQYP